MHKRIDYGVTKSKKKRKKPEARTIWERERGVDLKGNKGKINLKKRGKEICFTSNR